MIKKIILSIAFSLLLTSCDFHSITPTHRWFITNKAESGCESKVNRYDIHVTNHGSGFWLCSEENFDVGDELIVVKKQK